MFEGNRRATVIRPALVLPDDPPDREPRYVIHLDTGEDVEARHGQLDYQFESRTRSRLQNAGFKNKHGIGSYTEAVTEVLYAARSHDYDAKHPEDRYPTTRPKPTQEDLIDALSLITECRREREREEKELIDFAREYGATWDQIGLALGYTVKGARQGASQRHKKLGRP